VDFTLAPRAAEVSLVSGRGHYETVVEAVRSARRSVWIATANLKELMVEDHRLVPGRRRGGRSAYRSILEELDDLSASGVEIRILHAGVPSRVFREHFDRLDRLVSGAVELRRCPRVHLKAVVVDASFLYLGSANWTGAGLGAKGVGRRNFELGIVTTDDGLLDQVQEIYDRIFRGAECGACRLRDDCEMPLVEIARAV